MPYFKGFILILLIFMLYLHSLIVVAALGFRVKMNYWLIPAISALFLYVALLLKKAKRNWFVGIRTPWTLSSDEVWNKTHALASRLFALYAIFLLFTGFFEYLFLPAIILLFIIIISLFAYSYFEYSGEAKKSISSMLSNMAFSGILSFIEKNLFLHLSEEQAGVSFPPGVAPIS